MNNGRINDCPCDKCPTRTLCGQRATECKAVKQFYNTGWYSEKDVGMKMKAMKVRK
jgi:hypothetical protein